MPVGVELDKNGVDISDVLLKKTGVNIETKLPVIKKVTKSAYSKSKELNLNFDPSEVSLYDLPINKEYVKKINLNTKISQPVQGASVDQLLEFAKTHVDSYSNTSLPIFAPKIAISSYNIPHPDIIPVSKVKCNDEPLNFESINRNSVDYYKQYSLANYVPLGSQENVAVTSAANEKTLIRRLSEAKNTYRKSSSPLVVKYNNDNIKDMYEKRPKFENNKMNPFVGPNIKSHMKNHDRVYQQSLNIL